MANIVFVVEACSWQYVKSWRHLVATEEDLQHALDMIHLSVNPLTVSAVELRDYIDGRGELASRVELAGQFAIMQNLIKRVAQILAQGLVKTEIVSSEVVDEGDELEKVVYHDVFVRLPCG